jgi:hypothetical protein
MVNVYRNTPSYLCLVNNVVLGNSILLRKLIIIDISFSTINTPVKCFNQIECLTALAPSLVSTSLSSSLGIPYAMLHAALYTQHNFLHPFHILLMCDLHYCTSHNVVSVCIELPDVQTSGTYSIA